MPALFAQPYSARRTTSGGVGIVELLDHRNNTTVSIVPSIGNIAYRMEVNNKNVFWFPYESVAQFAAQPRLCGNPLLAPWANRLDEDVFFANGRKFSLDPAIKNFPRDGNNLPLHGLLLFASQWEVQSVVADSEHAAAVSRLEFSRYPEFMKQFPFAHTLEMTYALRDGVLEVKTRVENQSAEDMPLSIGYHPYFQIHDAPRDSWSVRLAADSLWVLNDKLVPTGETRPITEVFPDPRRLSLKGIMLDHVFGALLRDTAGQAVFSVQGERERIDVLYGPKYRVAVVYAPQAGEKPFICFEPMSAITNAFNLHHQGKYNDLQLIGTGAAWEESFWIRPQGF